MTDRRKQHQAGLGLFQAVEQSSQVHSKLLDRAVVESLALEP